MPKPKQNHKKLVFPKYSISEYTDGLIHTVLSTYKNITPADVATQIHAEVALIKARAEARLNLAMSKTGEKMLKDGGQ